MILSLVCLRENLSKIDFVMLVKKGNKQNQLSNLRMWCLLQGHYNCCTWISLVHEEQKASEVSYMLWLLKQLDYQKSFKFSKTVKSPPNFIRSKKERENIDKTPKKRIRRSTRPKSGIGSRLCKGKVLAPLTSIVLDGTHLILRVCVCVY